VEWLRDDCQGDKFYEMRERWSLIEGPLLPHPHYLEEELRVCVCMDSS
jgi:hypothetical protein